MNEPTNIQIHGLLAWLIVAVAAATVWTAIWPRSTAAEVRIAAALERIADAMEEDSE